MKVLSFDPCIEADINRSCAGREPAETDRQAIRAADAVILPRGCRESLYFMARRNCPNVFPDYEACYSYPGKTGQIRLFRKYNLPHPDTAVFDDCREFIDNPYPHPFSFPFVFKFSWGGEGRYVFLLKDHEDLAECLQMAEKWESKGLRGFLLQKYIPSGGRSLRAVVMGRHIFTYWRMQKDTDQFYTNLARGAVIDTDASPELQEMALEATSDFCRKTGINLAGLDFLFSTEEERPVPLFLEINYYFHYTGLGGPDAYCKLLEGAVKDWINRIKIEVS